MVDSYENRTIEQLTIEYGMLDGMSESNTVCALYVTCKILTSAFF